MSNDKPLTVEELIEILGSTVKHDDQNKAITFLTMLLTYTEEDQINLGYLAESSTGKSYIPLELAWYFPNEDVIKLGYASPTAFFYDYGVLMLKEGIPVNWEMRPTKSKVKEDLEFEKDKPSKEEVEIAYKREVKRWKELLKGSYYLVDWHQKIVIFLDMPHDLLLQRLRPLLSHDSKEIPIKVTDKRERHGLRTKNIVVRGYPTVIFCSAKSNLAEQEKTRLLLLSPEISQEKLRESIALKIEKEADREAFNKRMGEDPRRVALKKRVELIKSAKIKYVKIPEEMRSQIYMQFLEDHKYLIPRHQRDISRLIALIKAHALLNFMNRKREGDAIVVNNEDMMAGFQLYYGIAEANEMGLSPELWNIYTVLKPDFAYKETVKVEIGKSTKNVTLEGITIRDFQSLYAKTFHKTLGYEESRRVLKTLASVGLVVEEPDPIDKRKTRYTLLELGVKNSSEKAEEKNLPPSRKEYISVSEIYQALRNQLREPFYDHRAISLIAKLRKCSPEEAEKVFHQFVEEGKLFRDAYGMWEWAK